MRENGKTAVFIRHSINEALDIGHRIVVLHRPARIALDTRVARGMDDGQRLALRSKIMDILGCRWATQPPRRTSIPVIHSTPGVRAR